MLEINKLTGGYVNIPVLKEVSFSVPDGQLIGLIGLNGAGKSTTINEIIGLLHPYAGEVRIDGLSLPEAPTDQACIFGEILQELTVLNRQKSYKNQHKEDEMIIENIAAIFYTLSSKRFLPFFHQLFHAVSSSVKVM